MNSSHFLPRLTAFALLVAACGQAWGQAGVAPHMMEQGLRESSSDRQTHDELQSAARYWYESRNPSNLPAMDKALEQVLPEALKTAASVKDFQSWEEAYKYKPYHDAGAVLLAKCYTLLFYGDVEKARPCVKLLTEKLPYSMVLLQNRTVINTHSAVRYHEHVCALYGAIVALRTSTLAFPPERDEFDGPAQRQACKHMAILRLKEGNYDAVERFADIATKQRLCTSSGDWVINLIYEAMQPLEGETFSDPAWQEVGEAIKIWQAKKPKSTYAKIAEASFLYRWAWHATHSGHTDGYAEFRERSDKGRKKADSPAWYSTMIPLMALTGSKLIDIAKVFRDGNDAYPDYSPLYHDLCIAFARSGGDGGEACAGVIHHLVGDGHGDQAARVLWRLCYTRDLATVQARLDMDDVRDAIKAALAAWPNSLELHSDMGFVAISLNQKDLAREAMTGMEGKWDHITWKGREDIARELCTAKIKRSTPQARLLGIKSEQ